MLNERNMKGTQWTYSTAMWSHLVVFGDLCVEPLIASIPVVCVIHLGWRDVEQFESANPIPGYYTTSTSAVCPHFSCVCKIYSICSEGLLLVLRDLFNETCMLHTGKQGTFLLVLWFFFWVWCCIEWNLSSIQVGQTLHNKLTLSYFSDFDLWCWIQWNISSIQVRQTLHNKLTLSYVSDFDLWCWIQWNISSIQVGQTRPQ